jgi:hypothetical protein
MVERGHSPETAALALASRRARRTRSGPRLGCGSCGRTGACAIRSRCWTPLAPAACGQVWRRLPSRPATSGGLLNASPAGAGLIGRAQEGPPCLHSIRAAEPRVGWLQRWRLSANRPRRGSLSFVVLKQAVREETQRRRGRGRVALAPFSLSDKLMTNEGGGALKRHRALDPRRQRCRNTQVGVMPGAATLDGAGALLPEGREFVDGAAACGKDATRSRP